MSLQQATVLSNVNSNRQLVINQYANLDIFELVRSNRLAEASPDDLWNHLQSVNRLIANLTAVVDQIEGYLMSVGYSPSK